MIPLPQFSQISPLKTAFVTTITTQVQSSLFIPWTSYVPPLHSQWLNRMCLPHFFFNMLGLFLPTAFSILPIHMAWPFPTYCQLLFVIWKWADYFQSNAVWLRNISSQRGWSWLWAVASFCVIIMNLSIRHPSKWFTSLSHVKYTNTLWCSLKFSFYCGVSWKSKISSSKSHVSFLLLCNKLDNITA